MRNKVFSLALLAVLCVPAARAQSSQSQARKYPPIEEYLMAQGSEIDLAKSAAPANISDRATIKVLTASGFHVVHDGDNGFVCMVMRGFSAPTYTPAQFRDLVYDSSVRAPICFDPKATKEVMPYYESCGIRTVWLSGTAYRSTDDTPSAQGVRPTHTIHTLRQLPPYWKDCVNGSDIRARTVPDCRTERHIAHLPGL